jgi:Arm DNA-binding domain
MDELSDTKMRNATPADKKYAIADGQGLSVVVRPNGIKLWLYRYRFGGKRKNMSFGTFSASDSRPRAKSATTRKSCLIRALYRAEFWHSLGIFPQKRVRRRPRRRPGRRLSPPGLPDRGPEASN